MRDDAKWVTLGNSIYEPNTLYSFYY